MFCILDDQIKNDPHLVVVFYCCCHCDLLKILSWVRDSVSCAKGWVLPVNSWPWQIKVFETGCDVVPLLNAGIMTSCHEYLHGPLACYSLEPQTHFSLHDFIFTRIMIKKFVCLCGVYRPTREFITHMETSPLPVKGCKFWPMLSTLGHWAVRVL